MLDLCMFTEGSRYEQEIVLTGDKGKLETFVPGKEPLYLTGRKIHFRSKKSKLIQE